MAVPKSIQARVVRMILTNTTGILTLHTHAHWHHTAQTCPWSYCECVHVCNVGMPVVFVSIIRTTLVRILFGTAIPTSFCNILFTCYCDIVIFKVVP